MEQEIEKIMSTYAKALKHCIAERSLVYGKLSHAKIIVEGLANRSIFLDNTILHMYAKCGDLESARRLMAKMFCRNAVSWTVVIASFARAQKGKQALGFLKQMLNDGILPNKYTFAAVFAACASERCLQNGRETHGRLIRMQFSDNVYLSAALQDMYIKCGALGDARRVFDKMPERDAVVWNSMIAGYASKGLIIDAQELFDRMPEKNLVSWNSLLGGFMNGGQLKLAWNLYAQIPSPDDISATTMIAGLARYGHISQALTLFVKFPKRNVAVWNAIISGLARNGCYEDCLTVYRDLKESGLKPESESFSCALQACANLGKLNFGKEVHKDVRRWKFECDVYVGTGLVDMYSKCGSIGDARRVFDEMPRRDVVSWNAMIAGYAMNGLEKEALQVFEMMKASDVKPNGGTFLGVLSCCCNTGLLEEGRKYFEVMEKVYKIRPNMRHYCCMVHILGRAGCLEEAFAFTENMPLKADATVWKSLLSACKTQGNAHLGGEAGKRILELDPGDSATYVLLSNLYASSAGEDNKLGSVH